MVQKTVSLIIVLLCLSASAQAPSGIEQAARQAIANGLALMAAGDPAAAMEALRPVAAVAPLPVLALQAQCLTAAAMAMNGQTRLAEAAIASLSPPAGAQAEAAWKQALPACVKQLEGIAGRLPPDRRAGLFYFLGLIGPESPDHLRYLREAVKARPDFLEAGYQLALHLFWNGELQEAATWFRKVADRRPEWAEPRSNLGLVLMLSGRPDQAVPELRQALKIRPESIETQGQLGLALYAAGDYDSALAECGNAARMQAGNPANHNCTALVLIEKNRPAEAVAYARRAVELAPSHETSLLVLAAALAANGQKDDALAVMRQALAVEPRLRSDSSRLEKGNLLRGRALSLDLDLLKKAGGK
jgi:tetratricopeptide (TPR) repeat protein